MTRLDRPLDVNDRMLVNALGAVGEQIVAMPPAPDLPVWVERAKLRIDLNDYLVAVEEFLTRYVAFPSEHEQVAIALWVAHAHLVDEFETSPILAITSAEMRSGKTRVLDCLELLVPRPLRMVTPSEAVVYTALAERPRQTLLLDEADAVFSKAMTERYEGLRAILNAGNRKGTPVLRVAWVGKPRHREVEYLDVYGPKAIAGIGKLPTTVADRAIPIRMKRRAPHEQVASFRERQARSEAGAIRFPVTDVPVVPDLGVSVPEQLNDRAADTWEPLVGIAEAAGEHWAARARLAAVTLSGAEDYELSIGTRLLADIRDAFDEQGSDHLSTASLLDLLHDMEDAPWGDWYGKPLSARNLAKLLEPYRVRPLQRRIHGQPQRGYWRSEFEDAWARYTLTPTPGTSGTSGTESEQELLEHLTLEATP
jgi:hypothetical protein